MIRTTPDGMPGGFTLPVTIVAMAAMFVLAIGLLAVVGIESRTARSYTDAKRAELAARAGLEELRALLRAETANDDYLVISRTPAQALEEDREPLPELYIVRGGGGGDSLRYRHFPLFSTIADPDAVEELEAPDGGDLIGPEPAGFRTFPWADRARAAWIPMEDDQGRTVGRYAWWVEDLQGRIDARSAGNTDGADGSHLRNAWPFPAPGTHPAPLSDEEPKLKQIAIHALDPDSGDTPSGDLTRRVIDARDRMISPGSLPAAAGYDATDRGDNGSLADPAAAALEKSACPVRRPYLELPTVPFARGISEDAAGRPKLNLNRLLASPRGRAVDEFADWVDRALPEFDTRKGGFPDDYLRTLAANAFDYADADDQPSVRSGVYRGIDASPLLSEIVLQVNYLGEEIRDGRRILRFRFRLFAELWNMTDKPVRGEARVSYEVDLHPSTGIGPVATTRPFDDPAILGNPALSTHDLTPMDGKYWSRAIAVELEPDQYRFHEFADVSYFLDAGPASLPVGGTFTLTENEGARGMSLRWNSDEVDRVSKLKRIDAANTGSSAQFTFNIRTAKTVGKAAIPAHSYRGAGVFVNNMGDPRSSLYLRNVPLDENAYPENLSPHRRNVRRGTIYDSDAPAKPKFYGRVLPSEWPDGGHDSPVGTWTKSTDDKRVPTAPVYLSGLPSPSPHNAPQRLSNLGRFHSPTELGHIFDPLMWRPAYASVADTRTLNGGIMPASQDGFPSVILRSDPSADHGGGNTLRIGRPEHPRFDVPGLRAAHLLDLFHAGESTSAETNGREGDLVEIRGHVNLNTAGRDALRALAAGLLRQDPALGLVPTKNHRTDSLMAPAKSPVELGTPTTELAADRVADAILRSRPFACMAEVAAASESPRPAAAGNDSDPGAVFGNRKMYPQGELLQWSDAAAEELFARVHDAATLRSRNFRVWVVGQALAPPRPGSDEPEVLAESRKVFCVFADPGERSEDGAIDPRSYRPVITYENDF